MCNVTEIRKIFALVAENNCFVGFIMYSTYELKLLSHSNVYCEIIFSEEGISMTTLFTNPIKILKYQPILQEH